MIVTLDMIVRNGTLVTADGRRDVDIGIRDGSIAAIEPRGGLDESVAETIDATGLHVLPGVIDSHVHFREPGLEHEETWLTGTRAAVFGGVTTVLDMPNTTPPTDTVERARQKLKLAARSAYCDYGIFGLLGKSADEAIELARSGLVVGLKAFLGPTTGDLSAPDDYGLRGSLEACRDLGMRIAFHAEDRAIVTAQEQGLRANGRADAMAHLESRPVEAEVEAIDRVGRALVATGAAGHVLHISSTEGLQTIQRWRAKGADLTAELTPHHALLGLWSYASSGLMRVNPPIRGTPELVDALADAQVDCLGSDHAPHNLADKQRPSIWDVPAGIPGVETLLPLMLTEVVRGRLTLERLVAATSQRPAQIWGLWPRKGPVAVGSEADLAIVDLGVENHIRATDLHGLNNSTPFEGWSTKGAVTITIVRGRVMMRDGRLLGEPGWGEQVSRGR